MFSGFNWFNLIAENYIFYFIRTFINNLKYFSHRMTPSHPMTKTSLIFFYVGNTNTFASAFLRYKLPFE
jgi:hypothetical protein